MKTSLLAILFVVFQTTVIKTNETIEILNKQGDNYGKPVKANKLDFDFEFIHDESGLPQNQWGHKFKECFQNGTSQQLSPINIIKSNINKTIDNLVIPLTGFNIKIDDWKVVLYGDTVKFISATAQTQVTYTDENGFLFNFSSMAIHTDNGNNYRKGSEHSIDGASYPVEIQLEFFNTTRPYKIIISLLLSIDLYSYGYNSKLIPLNLDLFFVPLSKLGLRMIFDSKSSGVSLPSFGKSFSLKDFLNIEAGVLVKKTFYRYFGTLTEPPCTPAMWNIFPDVFSMNFAQLRFLQNLGLSNFRKTQPIAKDIILLKYN